MEIVNSLGLFILYAISMVGFCLTLIQVTAIVRKKSTATAVAYLVHSKDKDIILIISEVLIYPIIQQMFNILAVKIGSIWIFVALGTIFELISVRKKNSIPLMISTVVSGFLLAYINYIGLPIIAIAIAIYYYIVLYKKGICGSR